MFKGYDAGYYTYVITLVYSSDLFQIRFAKDPINSEEGRRYNLTFSDFINLNPSIDSSCSNLILGDDYCGVAAVDGTVVSSTRAPATSTSRSATTTTSYVAVPSPTTAGTTPNCYVWYTVVSGDSCSDVAAEYSLTLAEFIALNTNVDTSCNCFWSGYSYCVSGQVIASSTVSSVATTTSATSVTTPTPTQTGIASGCTVFYEAVSGDGCYDIASANGITLYQFYAWNTAVGACVNLWPGYYYCVGM
ncbi:hypothetical protein ACEPPN_018540 [Leptodophora sp. 'Broadleaf-Isolate-01']